MLYSHHEYSVLPVNKRKETLQYYFTNFVGQRESFTANAIFCSYMLVDKKIFTYAVRAKLKQILSTSELICSFKCGRTSLCFLTLIYVMKITLFVTEILR